jgi:hypothetical protein
MFQAIQIETQSEQQGLTPLRAQRTAGGTGRELTLHRNKQALDQRSAPIGPSREGPPHLGTHSMYASRFLSALGGGWACVDALKNVNRSGVQAAKGGGPRSTGGTLLDSVNSPQPAIETIMRARGILGMLKGICSNDLTISKERSVKGLISILSLIVLWPLSASWAQVLAPNGAGVALGHLDTNVRDVESTKKFWILLGGKPIKVDGTDVIKFPGVLVFLRKADVSGGTTGTSVDHVGFWVPNGQEVVAKLKAAGVKADPTAGTRRAEYRGYSWGDVYSPDDLKVEILEDKNLTQPIESDHIHLFGSNGVSESEVQAWYHTVLDARLILDPVPNSVNPVVAALIGSVELKYSRSPDPLSPTKGRAVERIGFEVKNLEAFCKNLVANGVKFDKPYSKSRHASFASAELTDPWGTPIELTQGLNQL